MYNKLNTDRIIICIFIIRDVSALTIGIEIKEMLLFFFKPYSIYYCILNFHSVLFVLMCFV